MEIRIGWLLLCLAGICNRHRLQVMISRLRTGDDQLDQLVAINRLCEVAVATRIKAFLWIIGHRVGGDGNDRVVIARLSESA